MEGIATYYAFDGIRNVFDKCTTPIPCLKEGEVLVKILFTTICRSDLNTFAGKRKEKNPTILGHEAVGIIAAIHETSVLKDLRGRVIKPGDRITWAIFASNPTDPLSKSGMPQKAGDLFKYGHEQVTHENQLHGGLATHIILRKNTPLIVLEADLSAYSAALINCAVATVAGALRLCGSIENKIVIVNGSGMLGLVACAMAKSSKASCIIAIDKDQERLKLAASYGASVEWMLDEMSGQYIDPDTQLPATIAADCVIDFTGNPDAMAASLGLLAIGGTAVWVGATYPQPPVQLNAERLVRNLWTIRGLHNYNERDLLTAVEFMENNDEIFHFDELIYKGCSMEKLEEEFSQAINRNHFRIGFEIN